MGRKETELGPCVFNMTKKSSRAEVEIHILFTEVETCISQSSPLFGEDSERGGMKYALFCPSGLFNE